MSREKAIFILLVIIAFLVLMIWKKNQEFSIENLIQNSTQMDISEVTDTDIIDEESIIQDSGIEILEGNYAEYSQDYELKSETLETINYTVRRGDSLDLIARQFRTSVNAIKYNNPQLKGENKVNQGDKLLILRDNVIAYKVDKGESLYSVSKKFGVTISSIQDLNHINNNEIQRGDILYIPIENQNIFKVLGVESIKQVVIKNIIQTVGIQAINNKKRSLTPIESKTFWPVSWNGITSGYGVRFHPVLERYIKHKGVDLRASVGQKVYAFNSGVVTFAGNMSGYGNLVIISHSGGLESRYGHLDSILVAQGQIVKKGSIIGRAGATGRVTGPHLHFEVKRQGKEVDPIKYLKSSTVV